MRIADRSIEAGAAPYVIAEIGVNHDGSVDRAVDLTRAAAAAGADAIKLQLFRAGLLLSNRSELAGYQSAAGAASPEALLEPLELPIAAMAQVVDAAHAAGIHAIVTPFCLELVDAARSLPFDAFKTASPDLINQPLIEALVAAQRPLIVSTGAATLDEVLRAATWLRGADAALLQCSAYPTADESAALGGIAAIARATGMPTGYSDHTTAEDTGALAVAAGACILEKHLTWSRTAPGPDHAASLEPAAFARYVGAARRAWRMLGADSKTLLPIEADVRRVSRQSLVAARSLARRQRLERADVIIRRPGTGLPPWRLASVVGTTASRDIDAGELLRAEDLA